MTWSPIGSRQRHVSALEPGTIIAIPRHGYRRAPRRSDQFQGWQDWHFRPWRVVDVSVVPEELWDESERKHVDDRLPSLRQKLSPRRVLIRPASEPWPGVNTHSDADRTIRITDTYVDTFEDRYPVCSCCGQLVPCLAQWTDDLASREFALMGRYERPGVCPGCGEGVTGRQGSVTFPENLYIPLGPPVTFHTRRQCLPEAIHYEDRYADRDPNWSRRWPQCGGTTTTHADGSYECSAGRDTCPGSHGRHRCQSSCRDTRCPIGCARLSVGCRLKPDMPWRYVQVEKGSSRDR